MLPTTLSERLEISTATPRLESIPDLGVEVSSPGKIENFWGAAAGIGALVVAGCFLFMILGHPESLTPFLGLGLSVLMFAVCAAQETKHARARSQVLKAQLRPVPLGLLLEVEAMGHVAAGKPKDQARLAREWLCRQFPGWSLSPQRPLWHAVCDCQ